MFGVLLTCVLVLHFWPCASEVPASEVEALRHLYEATNGNSWSYSTGSGATWNFSLPDVLVNPCYEQWNGLKCTQAAQECDTSSCSIQEISLITFNMVGSIPRTVSQLTALKRISVYNNLLSGSIPDSFSHLSELFYFNVGRNTLTGTLSSSYSVLSNMNLFDVSYNLLSGSIPEAYSTYSNFGTVQFQYNLLSGHIPQSITNQTRLGFFEVQSNLLCGAVPIFGTGIRTMYVSDNLLSKSLPVGIFNRQKLTDVVFGHNFFTGTLPDFDGVYSKIHYLYFENNLLTSSIPLSYALITGCKHFTVAHNMMTGNVPAALPETLRTLSTLDVSHNKFSGSLVSLFQSSNIQYLYLQHNRFTGSLPGAIGTATALEQLFVYNNQLTGTLPLALATLPSLQALLLQYNYFHGHLVGEAALEEASVTLFPMLQVLDISANRFSGSIPSSMFNVSSMAHIAILQNCFSGSIPDTICNIQSLEGLLLEGLRSGKHCRNNVWDPAGVTNTYFTDGIDGTIPECIFAMRNLKTLHITGNRLTGTLPSHIDLPLLIDLRLSYNRLSGTIPQQLLVAPPQKLDLSHNRFTGEYDLHSGDIYTYDSSLKLSSNRFSGHIAAAYRYISEVDVLSGNLFACQSRTDIPSHDPESGTYVCGSDAFDAPLLAWGICTAIVVSLGVILFLLVKTSWTLTVLQNCQKRLRDIHEQYQSWMTSISPSKMKNYEEVLRFIATLQQLRRITAYSSVFVLICFGLIYYCSKIVGDFGTHVYQYRWIFTAAYLSGLLPAVVMLIALLLLIWAFVHSVYRCIGLEKSVASRNNSALRRQLVDSYFQSYLFAGAVVLFDILIVVSVKCIYVYLLLWRNISYTSQTALNMSLSFFDLFWNAVVVTKAVSIYPSLLRSKVRIRLHLFLLLFNSIMAPIIAAACTDRNCFVEIFVGMDSITSVSEYELCIVLSDKGCAVSEMTTVSSSYIPPFNYNYQCMSSIITNFAPVLMFTYIILGFALPTFILAVVKILPRFTTLLHSFRGVIPTIFFPSLYQNRRDTGALKLFRPGIIISSLLHHVTVLLTFGVAVPLLGLCIGFAIAVMSFLWEVLLGRYVHSLNSIVGAEEISRSSNILQRTSSSELELSSTINNKVHQLRLLNEVNTACYDVWRGPLKALWVIVGYSLLFFVCLTMDIVGNSYGWLINVYCIAIPAFIVIFSLYLLYNRTNICRTMMSPNQ